MIQSKVKMPTLINMDAYIIGDTKEIPDAICCPTSAGRIFDPLKASGMGMKEVLHNLSSPEPLKRAIAVATLNALSKRLILENKEKRPSIWVGAK